MRSAHIVLSVAIATASGWAQVSDAADQQLEEMVCANCADPVLDQRRYTLTALNECLGGLDPTSTAEGIAFPFAHTDASPCPLWASYFAWLPTDDKIGFAMCGQAGHNGPDMDCVSAVFNYSVECLVDLDIFGVELCFPVSVELVQVETIAPNGHRDTVVFPVHDDGGFFGPLPRTDAATLPYASGAQGDGLPPPPPPPSHPGYQMHPPHIGHQTPHYGYQCTNLDWLMN